MDDDDYGKCEYGKIEYGNGKGSSDVNSDVDCNSRDNCRVAFMFGVVVGSVLTCFFAVILKWMAQ